MIPLWGVFLLVVLGVIWLLGEGVRGALRESYRPLPPQTVCEAVLLATIGLWAILRGAGFLITLGQQSALLVVAHWSVAALALLVAMYRLQQS